MGYRKSPFCTGTRIGWIQGEGWMFKAAAVRSLVRPRYKFWRFLVPATCLCWKITSCSTRGSSWADWVPRHCPRMLHDRDCYCQDDLKIWHFQTLAMQGLHLCPSKDDQLV